MPRNFQRVVLGAAFFGSCTNVAVVPPPVGLQRVCKVAVRKPMLRCVGTACRKGVSARKTWIPGLVLASGPYIRNIIFNTRKLVSRLCSNLALSDDITTSFSPAVLQIRTSPRHARRPTPMPTITTTHKMLKKLVAMAFCVEFPVNSQPRAEPIISGKCVFAWLPP